MGVLFGPVLSRRLGRSLGVDMVPYKTCSFDCIYCELGRTTCKTMQRKSFLDPALIIEELKERLAYLGGQVDYITLAGSGEPTLNADLGDVVSKIKGLTTIPIAVLTNSSLLSDPEVRRELHEVDLIVPSLDAAEQDTFEQVNLPLEGIRVEEIIEGLVSLRREFRGQIWLEILLCQMINDQPRHVQHLQKAVEAISPEQIQLNTVVRPPAVQGIMPSSPERLAEIAALLGSKAVVVGQHCPAASQQGISYSRSLRKRIIEMLKRRPCTLAEIAQSAGMHPGEAHRLELVKVLDEMVQSHLLKVRVHDGQTYYQAQSEGEGDLADQK
ncbi:MAG: radical SAM protein [bacterium]|nr:radical SAM protein [bacterium]